MPNNQGTINATLSSPSALSASVGATQVKFPSYHTFTLESNAGVHTLTVQNEQEETTQVLQILDGAQGAKGNKGDKGDKGEQGIQGIQGIQGEKGDKGDTGASGLDAPQVEDASVTTVNPWSSSHIVSAFCKPFEVAGAAGVSCYPMPCSALDVGVEVAPTQAGVPTTENPIDIHLPQSVSVTRCGKNRLVYPYAHTTRTSNGITFTDNGDGSITANGSNTGESAFHLVNSIIPDFPQYGQQYTASIRGDIGSLMLQVFWNDNGTLRSLTNLSSTLTSSTFTVPTAAEGNAINVRVWCTNGTTVNNKTIIPQIEIGDTATAYEPYTGTTTYTQALPADFYGGVWDVTGGKLINGWNKLILRGRESDYWGRQSNNSAYTGILNDIGAAHSNTVGCLLCTHYQHLPNDATNTPRIAVSNSSPSKLIYAWDMTDNRTASVANWKAYLEAQYAAGTPVTVYYKLYTPTETATTPQSIPAIAGTNQLHTNAQTLTVKGYENPLHTIEALTARVNALEEAVTI